jgi:hypothetical protein
MIEKVRLVPCSTLLGFLALHSCRSVPPPSAAHKGAVSDDSFVAGQLRDGFHGVKTIADIGKLEWVNKRCRQWAADGDIDIDQTCLVVMTVRGGLVVIPSAYADEEMKEITGEMGSESKDKWILRFFSAGGGPKSH